MPAMQESSEKIEAAKARPCYAPEAPMSTCIGIAQNDVMCSGDCSRHITN